MLFLWNIYLFFIASFHALALPEEAGALSTFRPAKRNLLQLLRQWSLPGDTQGVLGEYTETEYLEETSEIPRDVFKYQTVVVKIEKYEVNGTTESGELSEGTPKLQESQSSTDLDFLRSVGNSATPTNSWEWTSPATIQEQTMEKSEVDERRTEDISEDLRNTTVAPCRSSSNHSWTSNDTDDSPQESLSLSLPLGLSLFIPLYSDWNSALASWGPAWEAHVFGLGSVFAAFGAVSVVSLFGLPFRCPPGILCFVLLHFFLLSFAGLQAFTLIYDAYSFQDRLPPLALLPLCALPFPCLISAFSATFILLSLRSNLQISLPLAISPSFSLLPKPCLLILMSTLHFGLSVGCAGILELFPKLPNIILLFPQGIFVCLTLFLSCSYFVFYCLIQVDSKHVYRLDDNGESGGSPEMIRPPRCPFAQMEEWKRALRSGIVASISLLCCGGLQLYGVLHALGFGGYRDLGFYPWPWWGFQTGCRLSEIGVCLGLALIGIYPVFCHKNSSIKSMINAQTGSWSRLSPSREVDLAPEEGALSSHESWGQAKPENEDIAKEKSDTLPLCPLDSPGNGIECVQKSNQISEVPLPLKLSPACKSKNEANPLNRLDSTVDLRPPSPINLSRSIDQALYSDSLFSQSIFEWPRLFQTSSSLSLNRQGKSSLVENGLYRTSSCKDMDQEKQPAKHSDWKVSANGSTQELCNKPKEMGKVRSHSWANRGHSFAQTSLPRAITQLSHYKRFRTLSMASQDSKGSGRLAGTKPLSESKQLEWDMAVQAEFVSVCRQIDALSVCSDTIEL